LKSDLSSEPSSTFDETTAFFFSCAVPTLFGGKTRWRAAVPTGVTPSSATVRAASEQARGRRRAI
jgi:hypothetical protein